MPVVSPSIAAIRRLAPRYAAAAQRIYDTWFQDEDGCDADLGRGGICDLIASAIVHVTVDSFTEEPRVSTSMVSSEVHVNVVVACAEGVFTIDIPHQIYERGGGYGWEKIPGVAFEADDVVFFKLDGDPSRYPMYVDDDPDPGGPSA